VLSRQLCNLQNRRIKHVFVFQPLHLMLINAAAEIKFYVSAAAFFDSQTQWLNLFFRKNREIIQGIKNEAIFLKIYLA
jgi:hypothetical protein